MSVSEGVRGDQQETGIHNRPLARDQSDRLIGGMEGQLEGRFRLTINRKKTRIVRLDEAGSRLDVLGFTFRDDRDLYGSDRRDLNVPPSKKSVARARDKLRDLRAPRRGLAPATEVVGQVAGWMHAWGRDFRHGSPRRAFRQVNPFAFRRLVRHLKRRSQRSFRPPEGRTFYAPLQTLGLRFL